VEQYKLENNGEYPREGQTSCEIIDIQFANSEFKGLFELNEIAGLMGKRKPLHNNQLIREYFMRKGMDAITDSKHKERIIKEAKIADEDLNAIDEQIKKLGDAVKAAENGEDSSFLTDKLEAFFKLIKYDWKRTNVSAFVVFRSMEGKQSIQEVYDKGALKRWFILLIGMCCAKTKARKLKR